MYTSLVGLTPWLFVEAARGAYHLPGKIFVAAPDSDISELTPQIFKPVGSNRAHAYAARANLSALSTRQSCPSGYGQCTNPAGRCCPLGGQCCSGHDCCDSGDWCYGGGCCHRGEEGCQQVSCCPLGSVCCTSGGCCLPGNYCTVVNGRNGCCQNGQVCTTTSRTCEDAEYSPCSGDSYCCPPGDICYRDNSNTARCRNPSGPIPSYTYSTDDFTYTPTTTPVAPVNTTRTASTTSCVSAAVSTPSPPSGSQNIIVKATDPRIVYSGSWTKSVSACNSSVISKKCTGTSSSLSFTFSLATAIFMNVAKNSNSGLFSVTLYKDRTVVDTIEVDAYSVASSNSCGIGRSKSSLPSGSGPYRVVVNVLGSSPQAASLMSGTFELINFITVESINGAASASLPSSSNAGTSPNLRLAAWFLLLVFISLLFL